MMKWAFGRYVSGLTRKDLDPLIRIQPEIYWLVIL